MPENIKAFTRNNMVSIMFVLLCVGGLMAANVSFEFIASELVTRIFRNSFIVLALIIPIVAGMGINFGIVIGAMAAQLGIILVTHWGISGIKGILVVMLICTPLSILFGFLSGSLLNKMKGQEMIGSLIMGYFSDGIYQFITLFAFGTIIPMVNKTIMISGGVGIKNTIDLKDSVKYGFDNVWRLPSVIVIFGLLAVIALWQGYLLIKKKQNRNYALFNIAVCVVLFAITCVPSVYAVMYYINIPMLTLGMIIFAILFNKLILETRIGQEMRTVGQDRVVANAAGINVERTRVTAIIISTVLASWGQLISLQNFGTMQTYGAHSQVGLFAGASLLVGGATVFKATNLQALIGMVLFHTLFIISPIAGKNLMGNAQLGEYFRVFVAYGVICLSLVMHSWRNSAKK